MLTEINIKDFALIDELHLTLPEGFSVLTGETGAGKSIIIDAISCVLGERIQGDIIRTGADSSLIQAVFDVSKLPAIQSRMTDLGIPVDEATLIISRELNKNGKSSCRVNGRVVTLSALRNLTEGLIDIHGQHEHQILLSPANHAICLDRWCGKEALELRSEISAVYTELRAVNSDLENLRNSAKERARMLDLYQFQLDEINAAKLEIGEDETLLAERNRLANAEKLYTSASLIYESLSGGDKNGALNALGAAIREVRQSAALDPELEPCLQNLETALYALEEAQSFIRNYRENIEFNPARLEVVDERLNLIKNLKRKYGDSIEEILAFAENLASQIQLVENSEERFEELEVKVRNLETKLSEACEKLSEIRKAAAKDFSSLVTGILKELAMPNASFEVAIAPTAPGPGGADDIEFLISPNQGEPVKPLAKIASGGELSRIMLALKSIVAIEDRVPTIIFDEIDSGIGGRTALVIGEKLAELARNAQVLCVTHLPQIAGKASNQITVEKTTIDGRTVIKAHTLSVEDRINEIARMLGGDTTSTAVLTHAKEILNL